MRLAKDFYAGLEDKYYAFLDWLDKHGLPVYKVVDAIEANNIPSFPLFILLCIIIVALLGVFVILPLVQGNSSVTVLLTAEGNPVPGEKIIVTFEGLSEPISANSDNDGKAMFSVPIGKSIKVRLDSENYSAREKTFNVQSAKENFEMPLQEISKVFTPRTIRLLDSEGKLYDSTRTLTLSFSCLNSQYSATETSSNGVIVLEGIPKDCGTLAIEFPQGTFSGDNTLNPVDESLVINLSAADERVGKALITVKDSDGKPLAGKKVQLLAASSSENFRTSDAFTNQTGSALLENIPIGSYRAQAVDDLGEYSADMTAAREVQEGQTTTFEIIMQRTSVASVKVLVIDRDSGLPVESAKIDLFKDNSTPYGSSKFSDSSGRAEFRIAENIPLSISADHPEYMKVSGMPALTTGENRIELQKATPSNSNTLAVKIVDEKGIPVEKTKVKLLKNDASTVDEKTTGDNGIVFFDRLAEGSYVVKALKTGFGEALKTVNVASRQENTATITLVIGSGEILLSVTDEENNPAANAAIAIYDASTGEKIAESSTQSDGKASIQARADKAIFLGITAQDSIPYYTVPIQMAKGISFEKSVQTFKDASKLEIVPMGETGLYSPEGESVSDSLTPGQRYNARFLLKIPSGTEYSEAGVHLRTGTPAIGDSQTTTMEEDPVYIKAVSAGLKAAILKGKSYNPPNSYATDVQNITQGEAKWANVVFKNAKEGVYEIEAEVFARDVAENGNNAELRYRAWGKSAGILRYPRDEELGTAESTSSKQSLYAETKNIPLSLGPSTLCSENFCSLYKIIDLSNNEETAIVDEYSARQDSGYKLYFTMTYK